MGQTGGIAGPHASRWFEAESDLAERARLLRLAELAKEPLINVIPAQAGIQKCLTTLGSRLRGNDSLRLDQSFPNKVRRPLQVAAYLQDENVKECP